MPDEPVTTAQVRIITDGLFHHTRVEVDGKPLYSVLAVKWQMDNDDIARVALEVAAFGGEPQELVGVLDHVVITKRCPSCEAESGNSGHRGSSSE